MIIYKIIPVFRTIKNILIHKYWVYVYGRKIGLSRFQLILHDISKFYPIELFYFANNFYGGQFKSIKYYFGWFHHQKVNKHHAEYWWTFLSGEHNQYTIPDIYLKEMIVDWFAAAKIYSNIDIYPVTRDKIENWNWFMSEYKKIPLTKYNRDKLNEILINPPFNFPPDLIKQAMA